MKATAVLIAAALCFAVTGCKHRTTAKVLPAVAVAEPLPVAHEPLGVREPGPYALDSGDRLRVIVFGQDTLSRLYTVDGGGYISMPLIGAVRARGLSTFELERKIADRLQQRYVRDPKVTVEIASYRPFFILGEVRNAGQFPFVSGMTIQTAVAIAGGFTERANEKKVQLTRRMHGEIAKITVPTDYPVQPGDTIYVKERFF